MRSLLPLPNTRSSARAASRSPMFNPTNSPTRIALPYNSSAITRFRRPRGVSSTTPSTTAAACSTRSTDGRVRLAVGLASRVPGSESSQPARVAYAVKTRAAAPRRDKLLRAAPSVRSLASQLRNTRMSRSAGVLPDSAARWPSSEATSAV